MACSHASSCPLFPKLNTSLESWKISYCDTEDNWRRCERHRLSSAGKPVPLGMLPNGFLAHAIAAADARERSTARPAATASQAGTSAGEAEPEKRQKRSLWARLFGRGGKRGDATAPEEVSAAAR